MKHKSEKNVTRRSFLASSAAAVAAASASARIDLKDGRLRIGLLGPGKHGSALLRAMETLGPQHNANVVAVHRDSLDTLIRDGANAVIIATPDHLHAATTVAAIEAGLHVYCASPMARTEEDVAIVREALGKSDRVYRVGLNLLLQSRWQAARSLVQSGIIGDLRWCSGTTYSNPKDLAWTSGWRTDSTCTLGAAAHHLHELWATCAFVTGAQRPVSADVLGGSFETETTLPDAFNLSADFDHGLHFNLDCRPCQYSTPHGIVRGSVGSLIIERECIVFMPEAIGDGRVHELWRTDHSPAQTALGEWLASIRTGSRCTIDADLSCTSSAVIARAMDVYRAEKSA